MEQKDYIFEKLTPDNDVDISVYDEAMNWIIKYLLLKQNY